LIGRKQLTPTIESQPNHYTNYS